MHELVVSGVVGGLGVGAVTLVVAALHDVAARTVPNSLVFLVAVSGALVQLLRGTLPLAMLVAFLVFFAAALAWRRGWMGGGDVKLLGATALLVSPLAVPDMIVGTAISGGVLATVYLLTRRRLARPGVAPAGAGLLTRVLRTERWRLRRGGPLPYAVAIASGAFFSLSHGVLP